MKVAIVSLFFLFTFINSCNNKEAIKLSQENHLTEAQLRTVYLLNKDERTNNTTSLDSIDIGGGDPLPPCPDSSFTDCCPSLKYVSFKKGTKNIKIELLNKNDEVIQTFREADLITTKSGDFIFSLKKLKTTLCNGKHKLRVTTDDKKPYSVSFK